MSALHHSAAAAVSDEIYRDWSADRWAGSRVPAYCDWPTCAAEINRGRDFRCTAHGADDGCELFFCARHAGVPSGGGVSGSGCRVRDGVSHRAMVSENDQELTQKDTARWLLTSLPSSNSSGN